MNLTAYRRTAVAGIAMVILTIGIFRPPTPVVRAAAPAFPIRAAFYYPWFPEAWKQQSIDPFTWYTPALGYYDSSLPAVIDEHIASMQYAGISVGIASWWGQGSKTDQRIQLLLNEAHTRNFYWTLYYEPSLDQVATASDLTYIYAQYGSDPSFLHVNNKPVLFIYTRAVKSCADVVTWETANAGRFYLSPQVFSGYRGCPVQPDTWHQYAPSSAEDHQLPYSFTISPGFWLRTDASPRLVRDPARWHTNVLDMIGSGAQWQLITTFNEWGEGTAIEGASQWASCSGFGRYLEDLHLTSGGRPVACLSSPATTPTGRPAAAQSKVTLEPSRAIAPLVAAPLSTRQTHVPVMSIGLAAVLALLAIHPRMLLPR